MFQKKKSLAMSMKSLVMSVKMLVPIQNHQVPFFHFCHSPTDKFSSGRCVLVDRSSTLRPHAESRFSVVIHHNIEC
jgi:hypothetical protein